MRKIPPPQSRAKGFIRFASLHYTHVKGGNLVLFRGFSGPGAFILNELARWPELKEPFSVPHQ